ncbi:MULTISPECIES: GIY-YIG nuclease family protein [unclassified Mannheimia]|uniref:GIY-YIG nuclease family protein n=1 Tax=unclassified Mannheimia TaxID=2645054 RepID=UPI00359DE22D
MVTHTVIVTDRGRDNITVYTKEPAFFVIADRTDFNALKNLEEANKAGIYILLGENRRYIGQASGKIYDRITKHIKDETKIWWNKIIFFGREDGHLDKSQTDYLEKMLINEFKNTDLILENGTIGNTSYIDKTSKIKAKNVFDIVQEIMEEVAHINIFESELNDEEQLSEEAPYCWIELADGTKISGRNFRDNQKNFFKHLLNSHYRELVENYTRNGKPTLTHCVGSEPCYRPNGMAYTTKLEDGIYLYTHSSTAQRRKSIQSFADNVGLNITFYWE